MITENKLNGFFSRHVYSNVNAILLKDYEFSNDNEAFFTEIAVSLCKWLICCSYIINRQKMFLFTSNKLGKY